MLRGDDAIPLYKQIENIIKAKIKTGELKSGQKLPGEKELAKEYNVSRVTIRRTMAELTESGYLNRKSGKGSFVTAPKIHRELIDVNSFSDRMRSKGYTPGSRVISIKLEESSSDVRDYLELEEGAHVIEIRRIRYTNGEPTVLENSFLPYEEFPLVLGADINGGSLYKFLREQYNVIPKSSSKTLELTVANDDEAKTLEVNSGASLFLIKALVLSVDNKPIEFVKTLLKGDRFKFEI